MLVMEDRRKDVKDILNEELDKLRQRIIENHIQAGQRASGRTIKSLHVVVDDNHGVLFGRQALEFWKQDADREKSQKVFGK